MDRSAASASPWAPLRHGNFAFYQFARVLLILGGQMYLVALHWQVYEMTRSPLQSGLVGLAQFIPNLLLSLPAGHVADRMNRRAILVACALANAATGGWLAWQASLPEPSLPAIYVACGCLGAIRAFSAPAGHAFLPALVPRALLPRAVVWHLIVFQMATIAGPAAGGFVYAGSYASSVYLVAGTLFAGAAGCLAVLSARPQATADPEPFGRAVLAGLRYVRGDRRLLGAFSLDLFAVLLGGATALLPAVAKDILQRGPEVLGLLRSAPAIGAGATAILLAFRPLECRIGAWILGGVAVFGLSTIGLGFSTRLELTVAFLILCGASDMLSVTVRHTLMQVSTPETMRGRVGAVSMIFINTSNELGEYRSGQTAHWWGTSAAIVVGGIGTCAVVALWTWLFPELRRADRFERSGEVPPDPEAVPAGKAALTHAPKGKRETSR
ncbi:MAG: MFS transporter [Planctomycetota bacterium]